MQNNENRKEGELEQKVTCRFNNKFHFLGETANTCTRSKIKRTTFTNFEMSKCV